MKIKVRKFVFFESCIAESTAYFFVINLFYTYYQSQIKKKQFLQKKDIKKILTSLFKVFLGQKFRRFEYGKLKLNDLHRENPPALLISNSASLGFNFARSLII